jgi:hypothetical protein
MIVEFGTEAAQLLFWEYINEVFVAVREGGKISVGSHVAPIRETSSRDCRLLSVCQQI